MLCRILVREQAVPCHGKRYTSLLTVPFLQVQPDGHEVHCVRQWHQPSEGVIVYAGKWNFAPGAGSCVLRESCF